jgi:hypothetical protein
MLMRRSGIPVTYMIFDLLSLDGRQLLNEPYAKRRDELEPLDLNDVRPSGSGCGASRRRHGPGRFCV